MAKTPTFTNDEGKEMYILSNYRHCGTEWESLWDSACDDECPVCGKSISPYSAIAVPVDGNPPVGSGDILINVAPFNAEGARLFRQQRAVLSRLVIERRTPTKADRELLEGLMNFCDHIADELHDKYGFSTLFLESDESEAQIPSIIS